MGPRKKKLFCFGFGYTCDLLAQSLMRANDERLIWTVGGTTRDREKRRILRERGIDMHIFNYEHPLGHPETVLSDVTHLLVSTPPGDAGDPSYLIHHADIESLKNLEWIGYLSTTGVYGDRSGGWVDENSEIRPTSKRGSRRARAEQQWMSLHTRFNLPVHIFRLSGIYGPGRSALDSVRSGVTRRIDKPGHAFSRIHVEDVVQVLMASMANPNPRQAYNVSDDSPAQSHEVIAYACELLGEPLPPLIPYEDANLAPITQSFYSDNKRVNNNRIKTELGVRLRYPDFYKGLRACLAYEETAEAPAETVRI